MNTLTKIFVIVVVIICTIQCLNSCKKEKKPKLPAITFDYEKAPKGSGFKMDGYWIWGGSMIKVGSIYHLFASRWVKNEKFPDGYRQNSEIVRATSDSPYGPFKFEEIVAGERDSAFWDSNIVNDNLWPACPLEDFYIFKARGQFHIICEDNVGGVSRHERWGVHLFSVDGINVWKKYDPVVVYNHDILFDDSSVLHCVRRERPQFLITNGEITHLLNGVYDGIDSWCQPVKLKQSIRTD
jgi:hypothetical protein